MIRHSFISRLSQSKRNIVKWSISERRNWQRINVTSSPPSPNKSKLTSSPSHTLYAGTEKKPSQEGTREMKSPRKVNDFLRVHSKMIDKVNVRQKPPSYVCSLLYPLPSTHMRISYKQRGCQSSEKPKLKTPLRSLATIPLQNKTSGGDLRRRNIKTDRNGWRVGLECVILANCLFPAAQSSASSDYGKATRNFGNSEMHI